MIAWKKTELSDAYWFQEGPGVRNWQFTTSGVKLLNVANITKSGSIDLTKTDRCLSEVEVNTKYSHFLVEEGDLVIASSGISFDEDGMLRTRGAFIEQKHLPLCMNTSTIRFKAKSVEANLNFFKYWLDSVEFRGQITRLVTGSAQQNFGPSHLNSIHISLPPLEEQKRIAALLDKADHLRRTRRYAQHLSDTFLQSVFLEMFGDPVTNPMGWDILRIGELTEVQTGGTPSRSCTHYYGGNIPWVKTGEVNGQIIRQTEEHLTQEGLTASNCRLFPIDTILVAMYGQGLTRGRSSKLGIRATTNQACAAILPSKNINHNYLWSYLLISYNRLRDLGRGGNQPNLNLDIVKSFPILLPSLEKQEKFATVVQRVERLRAQQREAERQAEHLFQTLLHRAFSEERNITPTKTTGGDSGQ